MPELIGLREYARRRGVTLGAVQKAIKSGRIRAIDGKIDPEVADFQWSRNTDAAQQRGQAAVASMASAAAIVPRAPRPEPGDDVAGPQLLESRARREQALAELAELELAEKRGELVPVADIRRALVPKLLGVRDALDTLADRLAPLLAAEADPAKVYAVLKAEHRQILAQLSSESRGPAEMQ
jgi:hypothetical protein